MTLHTKLLFSSALVTTLACASAPALAQSAPPNTDYGTFKPLTVGTVKSFSNGRFEGREGGNVTPQPVAAAVPVPVLAPTAPVEAVPAAPAVAEAPVAVPTPAQPVQVAQPILDEPVRPVAPAPADQPMLAEAASLEPAPQAPVEKAPMPAPSAPAPAPAPAAPSAQTATATPTKKEEQTSGEPPLAASAGPLPPPVYNAEYPEEREAATRLAMADGQAGVDNGLAAAALRAAELPPVPQDVINNTPLSDRAIREIAVEGLQRIEPLTVQSYLDVAVGDTLTGEKRNQSLKNLYESGLFSDVSVDQNGDILNVFVHENPQINQIAFEGNKRLKDEELQAEIQLRPRAIYTREKALQDTDRILTMYRRSGRYAARVEPKVIELEQNRVDLAYEIAEGPVTDIRDIRFVGNKEFSDSELRDAISSKISKWYSFLSSADRYDPDRVKYDQEMLRQFYLNHGYADFNIVSALSELTPDQEDFYLTFTVNEGERYKIGKIEVINNLKKFDVASFKEDMKPLKEGDWYDAEDLNNVVDDMTSTLGREQFAFAAVKPDVKRNAENHTVDLTFRINESPKVYIERIDIKGNVRTLDKVVRREIALAEGDPFNKEKLAQSEKNIKDLNFFKNVDIQVKEGSAPDQVIIEANVEEQSTGDIQIGGGYSTLDGPLANFQIRERNFLGKGQDLRLATMLAGRRSEFDIGFTEPYFLDRKLEAGVDLFHSTRDLQRQSSYDLQRTGGALRLGYELSEKWRQSWRLGYDNTGISDVDDDASRFVREQEGEWATASVTHRITYDDRDSKISPHEGLYAWVDTEVAGLADAQFVKNRVGANYYYPLGDQWVFMQMGEAGNVFSYGDKDVRINERFYIGGNSMHGFDYGGLGPRDLTTDDALGGNNFYRGSSEVTFPISIDKDMPLKGHTFVDYGSVWGIDEPSSPDLADSDSIRVAAGLGISWDSPFGPLRVDFSAPIVKEDYDEKQTFRFTFGSAF